MKLKFLLTAAWAMLLAATPAAADYAQKLPDFGNDRAHARTLVDVTAIKVIETETQRGVIASYKSIYSAVSPRKLSPAGPREVNTNNQLIFITGLDHRIITDRSFIFHRPYGGKHLLFVWTDGIATVELNGKTLCLRQYTVDRNIK